ncbi:MAG: hypothetical protein IPK15_17400 [Verrucomicrobia bacterium]|nr:hypothetical protein [Verrucomicrobiota bacterium]
MHRSLAALALVVFVVAQAMCFVHCNVGGGHGNSDAQPSCHVSAQAKSHPAGSDTPTPVPTASCSTLKTMLAGDDAPALTAFQPHTLYLLSPVALVLDATATQPQPAFGRQAYSTEWTFTPEVCLGPALRSLAPPFIG